MNKKRITILIQTNSLRLILPTLHYKKAVFNGLTNEVTTYMYSRPFRSVKRVRKFITHFINSYYAKTDLMCFVVRKCDNRFLGIVSLHHVDGVNPEFGIRFASWAQGNGYAFESISALYNRGKDNLTVDYFKYPVDRRNLASRKIAEKLGGVIVKEYEMKNKLGKKLDVLEYEIR